MASDTNVGTGMVPCRKGCKCPDCRIERLESENKRLWAVYNELVAAKVEFTGTRADRLNAAIEALRNMTERKGTECPKCGQTIAYENLRVSVRGMYDAHCFEKFEGRSVDEIIEAWNTHNSTPTPAILNGREVEDLGPASLCPITLLGTNPITGKEVEIRRVGAMVFWGRDDTEEKLAQWREAALADADIRHILAQSECEHDFSLIGKPNSSLEGQQFCSKCYAVK